MKLPNYNNAIIDTRKILDYCLNNNHKLGRHKARKFREILGLELKDSSILINKIYEALATNEAISKGKNDFGDLFVLDFTMEFNNCKAEIRTSWIILNNEFFPRLTSCYIK